MREKKVQEGIAVLVHGALIERTPDGDDLYTAQAEREQKQSGVTEAMGFEQVAVQISGKERVAGKQVFAMHDTWAWVAQAGRAEGIVLDLALIVGKCVHALVRAAASLGTAGDAEVVVSSKEDADCGVRPSAEERKEAVPFAILKWCGVEGVQKL